MRLALRLCVRDVGAASSNLATPTSFHADNKQNNISPLPWLELDWRTTGALHPIRLARFWSKVDVKEDDFCWVWQGCVGGDGYGHFKIGKNTTVGAHRLAYALSRGGIPDGLLVCHKCDNRKCCNPYHLWLGTHLHNALDKVTKGRARGRFSAQKVESHVS